MTVAGARRAFVADGADQTVVAAVRASGIPIVEVAHAGAASVMAAITARIGEAPGLAIVATVDAAVHAALDEATRERVPLIVLARTSVTRTGGAARPHDHEDVDELARAIGGAARPLLVAGRGCRAPAVGAWLRAFAEALPAPVLVTPAGRGALPDPHPLCHGLLAPGAAILSRADLVITLGVDDDELASPGVTIARALRIHDVGAVLEELAPRLRDHTRADWDVAELDRLRCARAAPDLDAGLAALVARLREATPAGTAAIFTRALAPAAQIWHVVQPGEALVADDPIAASVAVTLERPEFLALAFANPGREDVARLGCDDAARAGVRVVTPPAAELGHAIEAEVARTGPRVIVVPLV